MPHWLTGLYVSIAAVLDVAGLPCEQIQADVKTEGFLNKTH